MTGRLSGSCSNFVLIAATRHARERETKGKGKAAEGKGKAAGRLALNGDRAIHPTINNQTKTKRFFGRRVGKVTCCYSMILPWLLPNLLSVIASS